jgi:signal transduction histidine kinase
MRSISVSMASCSERVTVRVLKHELRTPINHIIGYSELLLEDLADRNGSAERAIVETTHAIGRELLSLVNTALGPTINPDAVAPPDMVGDLRVAVQRNVDRMLAEGLQSTSLANTPSSADVSKILDAASRLAEFARTGQIRSSETAVSTA